MSTFEFRADIAKFVPDTTRYVGENAFVLIDCARLSDQSSPVIKAKLQSDWGFDRVEFFSGRSTQAFVAATKNTVIVTFRGTEPANLNDWFRNIDTQFDEGPQGKVHSGFQKALFEVWRGDDGIAAHILSFRDDNQSVWFSGHSLGGALAMLGASYLQQDSGLLANGIYTIGQPRVGNNAFVSAFNAAFSDRLFRFVNNNDIVTRVPAWLYGYRHAGNRIYFDSSGNLLDFLSWGRELIDGFRGIIGSIGEIGLDAITDHSSLEYLRLIEDNRSVTTRWS